MCETFIVKTHEVLPTACRESRTFAAAHWVRDATVVVLRMVRPLSRKSVTKINERASFTAVVD
jgi:hypothetical protein